MDTTEIYSFKENAWTEVGKLPARMEDLRAATINNRVLLFGNYTYFTYNMWISIFTQVDMMALAGIAFWNMILRLESGNRSAQ